MFITVCHLHLHDFLFYASREMGRLYETEKYLHNYGLTYALGLTKAPYANLVQTPRYMLHLHIPCAMPSHFTPSRWRTCNTTTSHLKSARTKSCLGVRKNWPLRAVLLSLYSVNVKLRFHAGYGWANGWRRRGLRSYSKGKRWRSKVRFASMVRSIRLISYSCQIPAILWLWLPQVSLPMCIAQATFMNLLPRRKGDCHLSACL